MEKWTFFFFSLESFGPPLAKETPLASWYIVLIYNYVKQILLKCNINALRILIKPPSWSTQMIVQEINDHTLPKNLSTAPSLSEQSLYIQLHEACNYMKAAYDRLGLWLLNDW